MDHANKPLVSISLALFSEMRGAIFTMLNFYRSKLLVLCNVTLCFVGPIRKLRRKLNVVNTFPGAVFTTLHFPCNLRIGPIS